jgi:Flp pilus assembly protein TadD
VQLASGKEAAAVQTLLKARRLDAENASLLTDLGWAYLGQGGKARARQAKNYFEEALKLDKRDPRALWGMGRSQLTLGDKESIGSLNAAVRGLRKESVADRAAAYRDLAKAHLEAGRKPDYKRARLAYFSSLDAVDDLGTRLALGQVLLDDGRGKQAVEVLEKAVALDAESAAAHLELGKARAAGADIEGARAALDRCLVLSPKGPLAREARKALSEL